MTATTKKKSTPSKNTSRRRNPSSQTPRKKITRTERQRQIQIRLGFFSVAVLFCVILFYLGVFPFQKGHAVNLTDSVLQYQNQVESYCEEYDISAFSQVVLAIMQQESAGTVPDVMQASESPFNTWYANSPNSITDPDYSIRVGVETFAYCLDEAKCSSPRDRDGLKLALQNYNYGNAYATWALENYGGYSKDNAAEFSENMKLRLGWSNYGDPEYVDHVLRYYKTGF